MIFPAEGWRTREEAESLTYGIRKDKYTPVPIPDVSTLCQLESVNFYRCQAALSRRASSSNVSAVRAGLYNRVFHLLMSMADGVKGAIALAAGWTI